MTHRGPFQPLLFCDSVILGSFHLLNVINRVSPSYVFQYIFILGNYLSIPVSPCTFLRFFPTFFFFLYEFLFFLVSFLLPCVFPLQEGVQKIFTN